MFDFIRLKSIFIFRINFKKSEIFLFYIKTIFRKIIKHKLLYLKINSNQINCN